MICQFKFDYNLFVQNYTNSYNRYITSTGICNLTNTTLQFQ